MQCRTWPFWQEVVESQESWKEAASECPGINAGTLHSADDILASSSLPYPL
jgi:Fe-S-cluster containining protein